MNCGQDMEGVLQRQVPPQLAALTKDDSEVASQGATIGHRVQSTRPHLPRRWHQDAGQHLDRGRLAGPVGTYVSAGLTGLDGGGDPIDGVDHPPSSAYSPGFIADDERPAQVAHLDDRLSHLPDQPPAPVNRRMPARQTSSETSQIQTPNRGASQPSQLGSSAGPGSRKINIAGR